MADDRPYSNGAAVSVRPPQAVVAKELPPLSEMEHARIKQTVADAKALMPELLPMMKGLHALGMIDGWRSVTITKNKKEGRP